MKPVPSRSVLIVGEPDDVSRELKSRGASLTFARDESDAAEELSTTGFDAVITKNRALVDAVKSSARFPSLHVALTPTTSFASIVMAETEAEIRKRHARTPFFLLTPGRPGYEIIVGAADHRTIADEAELPLVEAVLSLDVNVLLG